MRLRFLILITVTGSMLATVTTMARAASQLRSDIPACEELLTVRQAAVSMSESKAFIVNRQVRDSTRICAYGGGSNKLGHALGVNWGLYADVRKRAVSFAKQSICAESKAACRKVKEAVGLRSDLRSFAALRDALEQVGITTRLRWADLEGNPAFVWRPSDALAASALDQAAWVFVYDVDSASMLQVLCTERTDQTQTPDTRCAIAAAKRAYNNITS